jgi:hypothetical protein
MPVRAIAERFVELYWRQMAPWPGADRVAVLTQNTGRQAAVVRMVREARAGFGDRIDRFRAREAPWKSLTASVDETIRKMPLWRLQKVGREDPDTFLSRGAGRQPGRYPRPV